ncbi:MAG: glycosyltransferase [Flavobacteriaceae bacterium]|nr:glycosyltransferase [Flavobacteriaceae bacterium]
MELQFSIIIPVYNRPNEIDELLQSIAKQRNKSNIEIVIIDDGSEKKSDLIVEEFQELLSIKYFYKENSGAGDSRNYGMRKASGDYFIILDSDCILPDNYLSEVENALDNKFTDAYGGADAAHVNFTTTQKAINYSMTSLLTTGGIRGSEKTRNKFQLRSFNMGISKEAFIKTKGFSKQHFGEDIDLTFKLWDNNYETQFIPKAFVYHKRRSTWQQFFNQTFNFGAARPILNNMHPSSSKITFWFPSLFIIGLVLAILFSLFGNNLLIIFYGIYFSAVFVDAIYKNRCLGEACFTSIQTGLYAIIATLVQFLGYGLGFLRSIFRLNILNTTKEDSFPEMFS